MADGVQILAIHSISLYPSRNFGPCSRLTALRHNLREIKAELGGYGSIDATRMHMNTVLRGSESARAVEESVKTVLAEAGVKNRNRTHCQAIEAVFSLPGNEVEGYFERCLHWLDGEFGLPIISAVIHRDQGPVHMHALMLPLKGGAYVGSKPIGGKDVFRRRSESFFGCVARHAGLQRSNAKVFGHVKKLATEAVIRECETRGIPDATGVLWPFIEAKIRLDPTPPMRALCIDLNAAMRAENAKRIAIEIEPCSIEIQTEAGKTRSLSCVEIQSQTTPASATKPAPASATNATNAPAARFAVWAHSGCAVPKPERMRRAREAQQRAIDRHAEKRQPAPAMQRTSSRVRGADCATVRVREVLEVEAWRDL